MSYINENQRQLYSQKANNQLSSPPQQPKLLNKQSSNKVCKTEPAQKELSMPNKNPKQIINNQLSQQLQQQQQQIQKQKQHNYEQIQNQFHKIHSQYQTSLQQKQQPAKQTVVHKQQFYLMNNNNNQYFQNSVKQQQQQPYFQNEENVRLETQMSEESSYSQIYHLDDQNPSSQAQAQKYITNTKQMNINSNGLQNSVNQKTQQLSSQQQQQQAYGVVPATNQPQKLHFKDEIERRFQSALTKSYTFPKTSSLLSDQQANESIQNGTNGNIEQARHILLQRKLDEERDEQEMKEFEQVTVYDLNSQNEQRKRNHSANPRGDPQQSHSSENKVQGYKQFVQMQQKYQNHNIKNSDNALSTQPQVSTNIKLQQQYKMISPSQNAGVVVKTEQDKYSRKLQNQANGDEIEEYIQNCIEKHQKQTNNYLVETGHHNINGNTAKNLHNQPYMKNIAILQSPPQNQKLTQQTTMQKTQGNPIGKIQNNNTGSTTPLNPRGDKPQNSNMYNDLKTFLVKNQPIKQSSIVQTANISIKNEIKTPKNLSQPQKQIESKQQQQQNKSISQSISVHSNTTGKENKSKVQINYPFTNLNMKQRDTQPKQKIHISSYLKQNTDTAEQNVASYLKKVEFETDRLYTEQQNFQHADSPIVATSQLFSAGMIKSNAKQQQQQQQQQYKQPQRTNQKINSIDSSNIISNTSLLNHNNMNTSMQKVAQASPGNMNQNQNQQINKSQSHYQYSTMNMNNNRPYTGGEGDTQGGNFNASSNQDTQASVKSLLMPSSNYIGPSASQQQIQSNFNNLQMQLLKGNQWSGTTKASSSQQTTTTASQIDLFTQQLQQSKDSFSYKLINLLKSQKTKQSSAQNKFQQFQDDLLGTNNFSKLSKNNDISSTNVSSSFRPGQQMQMQQKNNQAEGAAKSQDLKSKIQNKMQSLAKVQAVTSLEKNQNQAGGYLSNFSQRQKSKGVGLDRKGGNSNSHYNQMGETNERLNNTHQAHYLISGQANQPLLQQQNRANNSNIKHNNNPNAQYAGNQLKF